MIYWLLLLGAIVFDLLLEPIKDYKLYYYGLHIIPFTRYDLVSAWERILFKITAWGQKIPYLIYRPQLFRVQSYRDDRRIITHRGSVELPYPQNGRGDSAWSNPSAS